MANVVELDDCRAEISGDTYAWRRPRGGPFGGGGGGMDEILKRLGAIESSVSEIRVQVSAIAAVMPHLATMADVAELRVEMRSESGSVRSETSSQISSARGEISSLKGEMGSQVGQLRGEISAVESRIIKWIVATVIATAGLAFSIAKFVH